MKTLVALALVPLAAAAAPPPVLSGLYAVGDLGLVQFSMAEGKILGRMKLPAECSIAADTQVMTGAFEGAVFVGSVTLCQTGPGCQPQQTYPLLGMAHEDRIGGRVKLAAPCQSKALSQGLLVVRPATPEEKQRVAGDASAAALAASKGNTDPAAAARQAMDNANRALEAENYTEARVQFSRALALEDSNFEAEQGLGIIELHDAHPEPALKHFDRALSMATSRNVQPLKLADIHYNRACAQTALRRREDALDSLTLAVQLGGPGRFLKGLTEDPDLQPLRTEPRFKRLVASAATQVKRKKPR